MQDLALLAVVAVLIIVVVSYVAPQLGVAAPVLLVIVGMACSQIPGAPRVFVEPEWILVVVLPPILYSAAVNVPVVDFRRNFKAIGALSVLLVVGSAFGTPAGQPGAGPRERQTLRRHDPRARAQRGPRDRRDH